MLIIVVVVCVAIIITIVVVVMCCHIRIPGWADAAAASTIPSIPSIPMKMLKVMMMDKIIVKSCFQDFLVMLTILVRQRLLQQSNIVQTPTYYQIAQ